MKHLIYFLIPTIIFYFGIFLEMSVSKEAKDKDLNFDEHVVEGLGSDQRKFKDTDLSAGPARSELFRRKTDFNDETKKSFKEIRFVK